jgi:hypothetical protein
MTIQVEVGKMYKYEALCVFSRNKKIDKYGLSSQVPEGYRKPSPEWSQARTKIEHTRNSPGSANSCHAFIEHLLHARW